jgi:hypothetical protein
MQTAATGTSNNRKPNMTLEERNGLLQFLLRRSKGDGLVRGAIRAASIEFGVSVRTISTLWKRARDSRESGAVSMDVGI